MPYLVDQTPTTMKYLAYASFQPLLLILLPIIFCHCMCWAFPSLGTAARALDCAGRVWPDGQMMRSSCGSLPTPIPSPFYAIALGIQTQHKDPWVLYLSSLTPVQRWRCSLAPIIAIIPAV